MTRRSSASRQKVGIGLIAWGAAILSYLLAVSMTFGKPAEDYLATTAGQWKYEIGPMLLSYLSVGLLIFGLSMFVLAAFAQLGRPR